MKGDNRVSVLVKLPASVRGEVARRARRENSNANDVIVAVLAKHYRVPFQPTGRRGHPGTQAGPVVLRLPRALKRRVQIDALRHESNMTDRVVAVLADELRLQVCGQRAKRAGVGSARESC